MMRFYWRWARVWLSELRRRLTERITLALLDRMGDAPGLDAAQRAWLLQDFREDLDAQIEDAEERGITERGAGELVATRAMVEWLEAGDFPPAAGAELLEKGVARTPRRPSRQERWRRDAYLAAIGELGGDEEAAAKLLAPKAEKSIATVRSELKGHDLLLPTSTPDIVVTVLPPELQGSAEFATDVADIGHASQRILTRAHQRLQGKMAAGEIILAIALKKSLRSDRLYQPLYEANIMQLLLEAKLGAPRVDFEVHTLESAGTAARDTYRAASLSAVATGSATPHRAVRDLYEPANADELVRRFFEFLNERMARVAPGADAS